MAEPVSIGSIECVADVGAALGEGPLWDPRAKRLIWVDIKGDRIFRFDPVSGRTEEWSCDGMTSAIGLADAGGYVSAARHGFFLLDLDDAGGGVRRRALADPEADAPGNRFNDGKVDPAGGFWAGTMDDAERETTGAWWRLSPDGAATRLAACFRVTNGPAFDPTRGRVFMTDSARRTIFVAETEGAAPGELGVFRTFGDGDGYPDGMEIDAEGCLWVAFWDGGAVRRFSPDADLLQTVDLPVPRPTSLAFAGADIFVTSARIGLDAAALDAAPLSGALFRIRTDRPIGGPAAYFRAGAILEN